MHVRIVSTYAHYFAGVSFEGRHGWEDAMLDGCRAFTLCLSGIACQTLAAVVQYKVGGHVLRVGGGEKLFA